MLTELPELTVRYYKRAESPQPFKGLVTMLLSRAFVDRCSWQLGLTTGDLASLIDEILQQISLVLGQEKDLGLLNDTTEVSDEVATFF